MVMSSPHIPYATPARRSENPKLSCRYCRRVSEHIIYEKASRSLHVSKPHNADEEDRQKTRTRRHELDVRAFIGKVRNDLNWQVSVPVLQPRQFKLAKKEQSSPRRCTFLRALVRGCYPLTPALLCAWAPLPSLSMRAWRACALS